MVASSTGPRTNDAPNQRRRPRWSSPPRCEGSAPSSSQMPPIVGAPLLSKAGALALNVFAMSVRKSALYSDFKTTGHALTLEWQPGIGDMTLKSITARRTARTSSQADSIAERSSSWPNTPRR